MRGGEKKKRVNSFKFDASEVTRRETKLLKRWKFIRRATRFGDGDDGDGDGDGE